MRGLPVFAEIDESFDIDPDDIEARITPRTKVDHAGPSPGQPRPTWTPILEIARTHKLRVLEDCRPMRGRRYKGKYVGTIGDIGIYSFQHSKTITAGEGGAVVTNDPKLFERAFRFHDVGMLHSPYTEAQGGGLLAAFAACNFRMNEFTGAVLCGQLQKLETICTAVRAQRRARCAQGIADLPGLKLRKSPDLDGDLGVGVFLDLGTRQRRDKFISAMAAEGDPASPPGGSVILPIDQRIEKKATVHPAWPSFQSPEGKAIRYGRECCPRTIDILGRHAGVMMDPTFRDDDVKDVIRAVRKVYLAMRTA